MDFRTPISKIKSLPEWFPGDPIVAIGSCFAQHMGIRLKDSGSPAVINPFGTLFSPTALEKVMVEGFDWIREDINYTTRDEIYLSWHHHSELFDTSLGGLKDTLTTLHRKWQSALSDAKWCIVTLGTAWVYRLKEHDQLVANCHKQPGDWFEKQLLSIDRITQSLENIAQFVVAHNPNINLVWTVSPVRHLKDGFVENQRSKAHLIAALHGFLDHSQRSYYFPAYEIVMDDLRDYRYYAEDMIHPSALAVEYIWKQWLKSVCHDDVLQWLNNLEKVRTGLAHRPVRPQSVQHQLFLDQLKKQLDDLQAKYPSADLTQYFLKLDHGI